MKIPMILVVALVSLISGDAVAQTLTYTRKDYTRAYWPSFGYIPGGPYVYIAPVVSRLCAFRARDWSKCYHH
jgi:hypothetical protein